MFLDARPLPKNNSQSSLHFNNNSNNWAKSRPSDFGNVRNWRFRSLGSGKFFSELKNIFWKLETNLYSLFQNDLLAWKYCSKCGARTKIKLLDMLSQNLSFAKFIDYLANAVHWTSEMTRECEHCTFHEHCHLFSMQGTVTAFEVQPVRPLHILFAPMLCKLQNRWVFGVGFAIILFNF